jgi:hypothetical protein
MRSYEYEFEKLAWMTTAHVTPLLRKVALTYNLSNSSSTASATETETPVSIETYDMPSLLNHSIAYAQDELSAYSADVIVLGSGGTVIDQYPKETGSQYRPACVPSDRYDEFHDAGSDGLDTERCGCAYGRSADLNSS